ncbi:MAG: hypothetical protein AB8I80_01015 [Anaerolineae bacterium]
MGAFESRAPKETRPTAPEIKQQVIASRREHPEWGKQRIADELAKANNRWGDRQTIASSLPVLPHRHAFVPFTVTGCATYVRGTRCGPPAGICGCPLSGSVL